MDHREHTQLANPSGDGGVLRAKIAGMDCGSCAQTIEAGLRQIPGVRRAFVDFTTETLEVEGDASLAQVEQRLRQLGYKLAAKRGSARAGATTSTGAGSAVVDAENGAGAIDGIATDGGGAAGVAPGAGGFFKFLKTQPQQRLALVATAVTLLVTAVTLFAATPAALTLQRWTFIAAVLLVGAPIFLKGLRALIFSRRVTIDLLMTIAALGAVLIGETGEAATVVLLFTLGEGLEGFSAARARDSLRSLLSLQPQTATVLRAPAQEASLEDHGHRRDRGPAHERGQPHEHDGAHDHGQPHDHAHDHGQPHGHEHAHEHDAVRSQDHAHANENADDHHGDQGTRYAIAERHSHVHGHDCKGDHAHSPIDQRLGVHSPARANDHADAPGHNGEPDGDHHEHEHARPNGIATNNGSLQPVVVRAEDLALGDLMLVKPGERIAADGIVKSGQSSVNQAAVTGESIPVVKTSGDPVMAGTINAEGALEVEVTRKSSDSTVARIAHLVEQAQAKRSPTERFIDQFARWYTPAVVVLAILLVAIPVLVFGQPLLDPADGSKGWLYRGLALLIVACPCALVISIPVTVVSSLTRLARLGVLVKGGEQLDKLAEIRTIAFDKTGTLTHGRPNVTAVQASGCAHNVHADPACAPCDDVVALAASVERSSEHPIARAIMDAARTRGLEDRYPAARTIVASAGRGVTGDLHGSKISVGTEALMNDQGAAAGAEFAVLNESNRTVMMVARDSLIVGAIGVEDSVRAESRAVLDELRNSNPPMRTAMLTGDNARVARDIASRLGALDDVRADLLPAGKLAAIQELQKNHGPVAMVGDGINDAPALATADVGIAMGGAGTAQAMETAAVVLMQDDLHRLPAALRIARRNRAIVKQNIALSLGLKLAFLALAIPGLATLWLAVVADVGATVLVTLNGMRMLRAK